MCVGGKITKIKKRPEDPPPQNITCRQFGVQAMSRDPSTEVLFQKICLQNASDSRSGKSERRRRAGEHLQHDVNQHHRHAWH
eukprot:scaffold3031_cov116-Skeletonema_dohrnii-CCMP3373.AAC.9